MRNAAELIRDATATGTYADYVGDGASVPWQVALPFSLPIGFTMWIYKAYLDARWPHAFKLHDWCYTPYSIAIDCTREEADGALYELIAVDSGLDAWVVYQAVRVGGIPYWQVSQTGYSGLQSSRAVADIGGTQLTFPIVDC